MKLVVQRVTQASCSVKGQLISQISKGFVILCCAVKGDECADSVKLAEKIAKLRVFADENSKMNLSIRDIQGEALVISQFTLAADCHKGNRPSLIKAADPHIGRQLYEKFVAVLLDSGVPTQTGQFAAEMAINLINDGPATFILDSRD